MNHSNRTAIATARRLAANPDQATRPGQLFLAWVVLKAARGQTVRQARVVSLAKWGTAK